MSESKKGYHKKGGDYQHGELNNHVSEDQIDFGEGTSPRKTTYKTVDEYAQNIGNTISSTGVDRSDEQLRAEVADALLHDEKIDARDIEVLVEEEKIFLRGSVDSQREKKEAQKCVESLTGRFEIKNELRVLQS